MQYNTLGKTDLKVSRLCLGCMTFGEPDRGNHAWTLPEESSRLIIQHALNGGINFFDTANSYSDGSSEEIVGRALRDFARREDVVVATKVYHASGTLKEGLSRAQILRSIDDSLQRLGMDYVDLLQIHRWDYNTPIEETLEALNDVVKAGKARYIGASSMHAHQFAQALELQKQHGWAPFVTMQDHYNLIYREEEREMLPLCYKEGVAVMLGISVGVYLCHRTAKDMGVHDHGSIVWDEFIGMWITLMALPTNDWQWVAAGFVIFRIFDMWKPWPIRWFDRNVHGGMGIMVDDILAGIISAGILYAVGHYWPIGIL